MRAFADALDAVPMALAENSGLSPIETLANIKSRQAKEKNTRLGVDCMQTGSNGKCNSHITRTFFSLWYQWTKVIMPSHHRCTAHMGYGKFPTRVPVVHMSTRVQLLRGV